MLQHTVLFRSDLIEELAEASLDYLIDAYLRQLFAFYHLLNLDQGYQWDRHCNAHKASVFDLNKRAATLFLDLIFST